MAERERQIALMMEEQDEENLIVGENHEDMIVSIKEMAASSLFQENAVERALQNASTCSIRTTEESSLSSCFITHLWCSYCEFSTDSKDELVAHMNENHMKTCPHCSFRSMSEKDITKHIEYEHSNRMQINCLSSPHHMDMDPVSICEFCGFMTFSKEHLQKHTNSSHQGVLPRSIPKWISKAISAKVRQADALYYSQLFNGTSEESTSDVGDVAPDLDPQWKQVEENDVKLEQPPSRRSKSKQQVTNSVENPSNRSSTDLNHVPFVTKESQKYTFSDSALLQAGEIKQEDGSSNEELNDRSLNKPVGNFVQKGVISDKRQNSRPKRSTRKDYGVEFKTASLYYESGNDISDHDNSDAEYEDEIIQVSFLPPTKPPKSDERNVRSSTRSLRLGKRQDVRNKKTEKELPSEPPKKRKKRGAPRKLESTVDLSLNEQRRLFNQRYRAKISTDETRYAQFKQRNAERMRAYRAGMTPERREELNRKRREKEIKKRQEEGMEPEEAEKSVCELPYTCTICGKTFTKSETLHCHMTIHTGEKKYTCTECGKKFRWSSHLHRHMRLHRGERPYKCDVCGKSYVQGYNLVIHMRSHTGERPFKCTVCDKAFASKYILRIHSETHLAVKPFKCTICSKSFSWNSNLNSHYQSHFGVKPSKKVKEEDVGGTGTEGGEEGGEATGDAKTSKPSRRLACTICGKLLPASSYKRHVRRHTGEKPFKCNECGKYFTVNEDLNKHIKRVHTKVKPYRCNLCEKSFVDSASLKKHLRSHTGERPFKCELCDKAYRSMTSLRFHMPVHTGEKRFLCTICGKHFSWSNHLQRHMMTHTGEKPYQCDVCGMRFRQWGTHHQHVLKKHKAGNT